MDLKEKLLWLYDKMEEIVGIMYDMPQDNMSMDSAIRKLWDSFNNETRLKLKLEG